MDIMVIFIKACLAKPDLCEDFHILFYTFMVSNYETSTSSSNKKFIAATY